jgi:hypothetical protein
MIENDWLQVCVHKLSIIKHTCMINLWLILIHGEKFLLQCFANADRIFPDLQALQHSVHLKLPISSDAGNYNEPESTKKLARQIIQQLPPLRTIQLEDELQSIPEGPVKPRVELLMFKYRTWLTTNLKSKNIKIR